MQKQNRIKSPKHRKHIASLPCIVTGLEGSSQAAHISQGRYSMGMKSSDNNCVPLSWTEHLKQHEMGEEKYWNQYGGIEKVRALALALYESPNHETDLKLINEWRGQ